MTFYTKIRYNSTYEKQTKRGIIMQDLIQGLNDKQKEAVLATEGPCLVIAGAGSRKNKGINT